MKETADKTKKLIKAQNGARSHALNNSSFLDHWVVLAVNVRWLPSDDGDFNENVNKAAAWRQ